MSTDFPQMRITYRASDGAGTAATGLLAGLIVVTNHDATARGAKVLGAK